MIRVRTVCFSVAGLLGAALAVAAFRGLHPWNAGFRERLAGAGDWTHDDFLTAGFWAGGAVSLAVAVVLGITVRRWLRHAVPLLPVPDPAAGGRRWFLLTSAAALAIFANFAGPRLGHSFWDDEQHTMLDFVHGQWFRETNDTGRVVQFFGQNSWWDTAFGYRDPNNHLLYSLAARISLTCWRSAGGHDAWEFSETAFRMPAFLAALLAIPAWGLFGRRLGLRAGALLLMLLLAVHPWFVRYGSEGRGYAFVLLLFPLHLAAALEAFRTGRWCWWMASGALLVLLLFSWPGIALPLAALQLSWLLVLWGSGRSSPSGSLAASTGLRQWLVANLCSGCVIGTLLAPCLLQSLVSEFEYAKGEMNLRYLGNFLTHLTVGQVWFGPKTGMPPSETFLPLEMQPWLGRTSSLLVIAAVLFLAGLGVGKSWMRNTKACTVPRLALAAMTAAILVLLGPVLLAPGLLRGAYLFDWYFIWFLPVLLLTAAFGAESLRSKLRHAVMPALWLACAFHALAHLRRLRDFPVQPMRESVVLMRGHSGFHAADARGALTAHINQMATIYDPQCYEVTDLRTEDPADPGLENLMAAADRSGRTLYVNVGLPFAARLNYPELMAKLDQPGLFEETAIARGQELGIDHVIYRYRRGAASGGK